MNGISAMEGLVQVYRNKTWGAVCDDHWGKRDADVICRTMGYNGSTTVLPKRTNISSQHEVAWRSNIQCTGNETTLFSCDHGEWTLGKCENGEQAFVACKRLEGIYLL